MARSRNIKPGFFTNDVLGELPALTRLLFAGIWTICDREGRLEDRPKKIRAEILPYDACDADEMLQQLHDAGFIQRYASGGKKVIQVLAWAEHQNPHMKEAASTLPAPDLHQTSTVQAAVLGEPLQEQAGLIPSSLIPDSLNSDSFVGAAEAASAPSAAAAVATPTPPPPPSPVERASRLPKDWALPKAWGEGALTEFPTWTAEVVRAEASKFRDHWVSKSGKDATKLDWQATWRNWCRNARVVPGGRPGGPMTDEQRRAANDQADREAKAILFGKKQSEVIDV